MYILADKITNRLVYTLDFVFKSRQIDYTLIADVDKFQNFEGIKLNYSSHRIDVPTIVPSTLLFEEGISTPEIKKSNFENAECLSLDGITDPCASIFYVLTRYEEYITSDKDEHGRFPYSASILKKFGWIEQCICDRIAHEIIQFTGLEVNAITGKPTLVPTFDIDNTYAYKFKDARRKFFSRCKDAIKLDFMRLRERKAVARGEKDPYDTFDRILEIGKQYKNTKLFWLVGDSAKRDRNISAEHPDHQKIIREMSQKVEVNLHPSYASNSDKQALRKEKVRLENLTGATIQCSRQHFLRFELPKTYRALIACGFTHEYSMGFAENVGFRAGTARAHEWYDLLTNVVTNLTVHPFAYMDGTLNEYMKLSIEESQKKVEQLYHEVATYGGDFVFIWHNETIGGYKHWKGWDAVLVSTLNLNNE
jgi:hypothetical protein